MLLFCNLTFEKTLNLRFVCSNIISQKNVFLIAKNDEKILWNEMMSQAVNMCTKLRGIPVNENNNKFA